MGLGAWNDRGACHWLNLRESPAQIYAPLVPKSQWSQSYCTHWSTKGSWKKQQPSLDPLLPSAPSSLSLGGKLGYPILRAISVFPAHSSPFNSSPSPCFTYLFFSVLSVTHTTVFVKRGISTMKKSESVKGCDRGEVRPLPRTNRKAKTQKQ